MAAVLGLDDDAIMAVCQQVSSSGVAEAVNFNSPGQVVVAGQRGAVETLLEKAREAGARRAILLPVSVPAHSSLMRPAGEALAETIAATAFSDPVVEVVSAVDGVPFKNAADIRERMQAQVYSPVRWVDTIQCMTSAGVTSMVECGPGKVLTGLLRRIDRGIAAVCLDSSAAIQSTIDGARE